MMSTGDKASITADILILYSLLFDSYIFRHASCFIQAFFVVWICLPTFFFLWRVQLFAHQKTSSSGYKQACLKMRSDLNVSFFDIRLELFTYSEGLGDYVCCVQPYTCST